MDWKQLYAAWEKGDFAPVYLFHGEEEYIKQSALARLRSLLLPAGLEALNETLLEGAVDAGRIIEAAETLPMMCEKRLVVVKDWAPLLSARAKNEGEDAARLADWLPKAPETCVTVFYLRGKCQSNGKCAKALREKGAEAVFAPLDEAQLQRWIRQKAKEAGAAIDPQAVEALVFAAGRDCTRLIGEIEKLTSYAGPGGTIRATDVQSIVAPSVESTVFTMIDQLTAGRFPAAQRLLDALLNAGENRVRALYMITRQMRLLALAREMLDAKTPLPRIQESLGVTSYGARRLVEQARRMPLGPLRAAYRDCVDAEYAVKSGQARDEAALDRIMLQIAGMGR